MAKKANPENVASAIALAAKVGQAVASADGASLDVFADARKACLVPPVQGVKESAEDYSKRCAAFKAAPEVKSAWMESYVTAHQSREFFPIALYIIGETDGKCRDVKKGDGETKIRKFTPAQAFLMSKSEFSALPGDSKDKGTVKGRVWILRDGIGDSAGARFRRFVNDAVRAGAAASADEGESKRAKNRSPAEIFAQWRKRGISTFTPKGGDKKLAFSAAFGAFVDDCVARGLFSGDDWQAALKAKAE